MIGVLGYSPRGKDMGSRVPRINRCVREHEKLLGQAKHSRPRLHVRVGNLEGDEFARERMQLMEWPWYRAVGSSVKERCMGESKSSSEVVIKASGSNRQHFANLNVRLACMLGYS